MMYIPVEIVINYNTKVFVVVMGVSLILYDVEVLQFSDIWMLLEELNDKRDVVLQEDKLSKSCWSCC